MGAALKLRGTNDVLVVAPSPAASRPRFVAHGRLLQVLDCATGPPHLRYADASAFAARLRWMALRIRLRIRSDFGVASTYSSASMYSIARSRLIFSGASS